MTIILTCLTNQYVVQASDRQLSVHDEKGHITPVSHDSNKALTYKNQFSFAYTGLAELPIRKSGKEDKQTAIEWATERLTEGKNLEEALNNLKYRITDLMNLNQIRKLPAHKRRLAFVGSGFEEIAYDSRLTRCPLYVLIENFIEDDGTYLNEPRDEFRLRKERLDSNIAALFVAGQQLHPQRERELTRILKLSVRHHVKPKEIGVLLVQEIQAMAAKENSVVGKNCMCTFVPRAYAEFLADNHLIHISTIQMETPLTSAVPGLLKPVENAPLRDRIVILGKFDAPRSIYISGDGSALPSYSPLYAHPSQVVSPIIISDMSLSNPSFVPNPQM